MFISPIGAEAALEAAASVEASAPMSLGLAFSISASIAFSTLGGTGPLLAPESFSVEALPAFSK